MWKQSSSVNESEGYLVRRVGTRKGPTIFVQQDEKQAGNKKGRQVGLSSVGRCQSFLSQALATVCKKQHCFMSETSSSYKNILLKCHPTLVL